MCCSTNRSRLRHHVPSLLRIVTLLALLLDSGDAVKGGPKEVMLVKHIKTEFKKFHPRAIIDVGANRGEWTTRVRNEFYPNSKYLMVEATPDKHGPLKEVVAAESNNNNHTEFRIAVLSETSGQTVSFFQGGDTGNSMFREKTKFYKKMKSVNRTTTTLDEIIEQSTLIDFEHVDILKLDVQGAEVSVLKGATKALEHATFVVSETGPIEFNTGGACFHELDDLLRRHGFYLYEIGQIARLPHLYNSPGVGQMDVLYVKPSSPRLPKKLANAKFCGHGRVFDTPTSSSTSSATTTGSLAVKAAGRVDATTPYFDSEHVLRALDGNLVYLVEKKQQRPGVFFLLGFVSCAVIMSAWQRIRRLPTTKLE